MGIKRYYLLTTEFPPFYGGGISTYAWHTSQMFIDKGIEFSVFVPYDNIDNDFIVEERGKLRIIKFRNREKPYYSFLGNIFAQSYDFSEVLKSFIKQEGLPDIVEIQDYLGIGYYTLQRKYALESPFKDLKIIMTLHTPKFICDHYNEAPLFKLPDYFIGEAEKWCIKAVDGIISPSKYLVEELRRWKELKNINPAIIHNPYIFSDLPNEKTGRDVVFFGRLENRKGIFEILNYMVNLWNEGKEIPIYLIGGDTLFHPKGKNCYDLIKNKYERFIKEGYLVIEGKLKPEEIKKRFIERTKIGIIGSIFENFPYALLELIESGVIAIVSDSGGHLEIIEDGKSGFVFSHREPESFREKLLKSISLNEIDLESFRINALNIAKELCSYEKVFNNKMEFIERVTYKPIHYSIYPFIKENEEYKPELNFENNSLPIKKGLLSIVIPYYNLGKLLLDTIESIENANYPDKEILVVDDGSNDKESLVVLDEILKNKPHINIISTKNEGLALARNKGALSAKGEFLAFLDADDLVHQDYYATAIEILNTYENVSFVGSWVKYFGDSENVWPTFNPEFPFILFHNTINSSSLVLKKEDFIKYGLNDPQMKYGMEDYDFVINMIKNGKRGIVIPRELFYYRVRKNSMLRQFNPYTYLYLYNKLTEKHKELYKNFSVELFNLQNANGPAFMIDNPTLESFIYTTIREEKNNYSDLTLMPRDIKISLKKLWNYRVIRILIKVLAKIIK